MSKAFSPHELEARRNGTPTLGAGKIYDVPEEEILVNDFPIPDHFWLAYGLDVGWNRTAAIWTAEDRDADVVYLWSEHYAGDAIPAVHATAIKARGHIPGVIDPASRGRNQVDGQRLLDLYAEAGLDLTTADNAVEAGILAVRERLVAGKLKVFRSLGNFVSEYRLYRRDEKGKVVKMRDHLMDAARYAIMSGLDRARQRTRSRQANYRQGLNSSRVFSG
jgi:hypothetical protein